MKFLQLIIKNNGNLRFTIFLLLCSFIAAHFCFWLLPNVFETWNKRAIDRLFLFRSSSAALRPAYDDTIVHVDINDTTVERLNNFYINRSHHARVIQNLGAMKVTAQLYDLIFAARTEDKYDKALIDATAKAKNVYFGMAFGLRRPGDPMINNPESAKGKPSLDHSKWEVIIEGNPSGFYIGTDPIATFPDLALRSRGVGYLSLKIDPDGVYRRIPLLVRYNQSFYPSFAFRAVCNYLDVPPDKIVVRSGKAIILKDAKRPETQTSRDIAIPIDRHGNMIINYVGPWDRMDHYNFADVLTASDDPDEWERWQDELSGKIVVVSEVLTGASDLGSVPTDPNFPLSGIHANVIHTILTESFLWEISGPMMIGIEVLLLICVFLFSLRLTPVYFSLGTIGVGVVYVGVVGVGFFYGHIILHLVRPVLMIALALVSILIHRYIKEEKERSFIRATFGRYLSNEVVEELLEAPDGLEMNGEIRRVTFLVSDLRGFTALSTQFSPHTVIDIINRYLECMVEIITRHQGTVNEIEGDGILTFFGAPVAISDHEERAIACAIEMQNAMLKFNEKQKQLKLPELSMGIGINTGDVVVGNIGSEKRAKYCAIGSAINIAYRIESRTAGGQILISPSTYEKVGAQVHVKETGEVRLKGISHPMNLYEIVSITGKYQLPIQHRNR